MKGRGGGKEREAPTHLIENLKLSHAARFTKNKKPEGLKCMPVAIVAYW